MRQVLQSSQKSHDQKDAREPDHDEKRAGVVEVLMSGKSERSPASDQPGGDHQETEKKNVSHVSNFVPRPHQLEEKECRDAAGKDKTGPWKQRKERHSVWIQEKRQGEGNPARKVLRPDLRSPESDRRRSNTGSPCHQEGLSQHKNQEVDYQKGCDDA